MREIRNGIMVLLLAAAVLFFAAPIRAEAVTGALQAGQEEAAAAGKASAKKKRVLFVGDSITWGYVTKKKRAAETIPAIVQKKRKVTCKNAGKVGALLSNHGDKKISVVNRLANNSLHLEKYDVIVIEAGTNDFAHSVKIGKIGDKSKKTFYGAWNKVFRYIKKYNPKAKVVIITPIYRTKRCIGSWKSGYRMTNAAGISLKQYVKAEKAIAKKYHAYLYDSQAHKVITKSNAKKLLADGLHPNSKGYRKLGKSIAAYLKKVLR